MSNPTKPITPPLAPTAAEISSLPLSADSTSLDSIEQQLKYITLQRMLREEAEHADTLESQKRSRQAGIESVKLQMRNDAARQSVCSHQKENGRSNLAGQKDHAGVQHLICQRCQKHFVGNEVPPHLQPMHDTVGGPQ